jgi:hypothetical protein
MREMRGGLLLLALLGIAACGGNAPQASDGNTYRSEAHLYEVTYPAGWQVVGERLTPNLDDPREILALATYEAPTGGDRCAHQPVAALEAMGRADVLIAVFERRPPWPENRYPPRRGAEVELQSGTGRFCVPDANRLDAWLSFRDAGRAFYLLVAVGPEAPARIRQDVNEILDSLTFQPS